VPAGSAIRSLSDLRGKVVGLHYNDPELFDFACAALRGAGVDPLVEVSFRPLDGSPLDSTRMARSVRDGDVDAVWQLDVLTGFLAAEGVPTRLLPASAINRLTPSSSFMALDRTLAAKPEAFGALGRALAKATAFALENPAAAIHTIWRAYPDSAPAPEQAEAAFRGELAALTVRLAGHRIETGTVPLWGAISERDIDAWQDFLLETKAIGTRRPARAWFSDALVGAFNAFDPEPIVTAARGWVGSGHGIEET
jgi:NitT/TauT family transport system substrate-binding protein